MLLASYSVANLNSQGTPGTPQTAPPNGAQAYSATDFGARGDCTTDDTSALQAAFDAVLNQVGGGSKVPGKVSLIAGRCYKITSTLTLSSVRDGIFEGNGAVIQWNGGSSVPAILLTDVRDTTLANFRIGAGASFPLATAIRIENGAGSIITPSSDLLENIIVETEPGGLGTGVHIAQGAGGNFNNENHSLSKVRIRYYTDAAFKIDSSQSKGIQFRDCECTAHIGSTNSACLKSGLVSGGSFHWHGGSGGGNGLADFQINNATDTMSVTGFHSERSKRFLVTGGPSNAPLPLRITGVRFAADGLASDRVAIDCKLPGPLMVENSTFGEANQALPKIRITATGPASATFIGNLFGSYNSVNEDPLELVGNSIETVWMNNSFVDGAGSLAKRDGLRVLGTLDASGAIGSSPARVGATLPLVCALGELFVLTSVEAGRNLHVCSLANRWTQIGAASSGGTPPPAPDATLPTVSINNVAQGAQLSGIFTVTATASDNVGVARVEFLVDGALAGTSTGSPYTFNWNTTLYPGGTHTLQAKAYDTSNNVGLGTLLTVTLVAGGGSGTSFITNVVPGTRRNDYGGWVGMRVLVGSSPVSVFALGRYVLSGNAGTHRVKLVNASTGVDAPGGTVTINISGAAGQFQYANLTAPITLPANSTWYVTSEETVGGDFWHDSDSVVSTTGVATLVSAVYWNGVGWTTTGIQNRMYVPVSFKY